MLGIPKLSRGFVLCYGDPSLLPSNALSPKGFPRILLDCSLDSGFTVGSSS